MTLNLTLNLICAVQNLPCENLLPNISKILQSGQDLQSGHKEDKCTNDQGHNIISLFGCKAKLNLSACSLRKSILV